MQLFDESHVQGRTKRWERAVDKGFAEVVENLTYKGLYARTVLEPKVRQLCVISGLTVLNAIPQLKGHIKVALRVGATEAEVKEAIIQMLTYCGMPYVMQAYVAFSEVVRKHKGKEK